eukprot:scaffold7750_cov47-Phaeocystis_antarctica.AAC.1
MRPARENTCSTLASEKTRVTRLCMEYGERNEICVLINRRKRLSAAILPGGQSFEAEYECHTPSTKPRPKGAHEEGAG